MLKAYRLIAPMTVSLAQGTPRSCSRAWYSPWREGPPTNCCVMGGTKRTGWVGDPRKVLLPHAMEMSEKPPFPGYVQEHHCLPACLQRVVFWDGERPVSPGVGGAFGQVGETRGRDAEQEARPTAHPAAFLELAEPALGFLLLPRGHPHLGKEETGELVSRESKDRKPRETVWSLPPPLCHRLMTFINPR